MTLFTQSYIFPRWLKRGHLDPLAHVLPRTMVLKKKSNIMLIN